MDADGYPEDGPPPDAEGLDRPDEVEDQLDDLADEFNAPEADMDADEAPAPADDSDDESLLSEVDEAQFADFDPKAVEVAPDFDALKSIKAVKRKRTEGEEPPAKKKKEKRRERPSRRADSEGVDGDNAVSGKRRKPREPTERAPKVREEIDEESLSPEERRKRALDRAMDAALKKSSAKRVRKGEIVRLPFPIVSHH
jgi:transcription factor SPN1